jgi:hypothetical protein
LQFRAEFDLFVGMSLTKCIIQNNAHEIDANHDPPGACFTVNLQPVIMEAANKTAAEESRRTVIIEMLRDWRSFYEFCRSGHTSIMLFDASNNVNSVFFFQLPAEKPDKHQQIELVKKIGIE